MKKILTLVAVSALGSLLTLGGYKLFIEEENKPIIEIAKPQLPNYVPTTYTNTVLTNTERPNLVEAANKTIDAVVHVKNTAISRGFTSFNDVIRGRPSCLLYTSPSPRDRQKSRMPSSA